MTDWDSFRFALALHRHATLKAAAIALRVDQTTVARRVAALENALGSRLFEKRSNGFFLTLAGSRVLPTLETTEASFLSMERLMAGQEERVEGVVRIALPGALANHWLVPNLGRLLSKHPTLSLELLTGAEVLNLSRREADIALRLVRPQQRDLIVRKLGEMELALCGPASLPASGTRKRSLPNLPFIGLYQDSTSESELQLLKILGPKLRCAVRSAAWSSVHAAVRAGLGIGILPSFMADRDPLVRRLSGFDPVSSPIWLAVHPEIAGAARVRAVINFLTQTAI